MNINILHRWFIFATAVLGALTGFCVFRLRRFDLALVFFVFWFYLALLEAAFQKMEEEEWRLHVCGK